MADNSSISRRGFMLTTAAGGAGGMFREKATLGAGYPHQIRKRKGISTGFAQIDGLNDGLHRGALTLLASRPAAGKTALALNITDFVSVECAVTTVYFCFNTSILEIARRLVFSRGGVSHAETYRRPVPAEVRQRVVDAAAELSDSSLHLDDEPLRTAAQIRKVAEQINGGLADDKGLGLLVVDHLHCVAADNTDGKSRDEHLIDVTRELRTIAQDLKVAVLGLVQLNCPQSAVVYDDPVLNQLCDVQSVADTVMLLHGPEYDRAPAAHGGAGPESISFLSVITRTDGYAKTAELYWDSQYARFSEYVV